jgi:Tfp pilus assembly protein PilW
MKINYHKISKLHGLSLFELVLTIAISSIVFSTLMLFVNSTINATQQLSYSQQKYNNSARVVLNILTQDLMNNTGNLQLIQDNNINTLTLSFNLPDPNNANLNIIVAYIYDATYKQLYRKLGSANSQLLLSNVNTCNFTKTTSTNTKNITLTVKMLIQQHNTTLTVYEVINAF